MNTEQIDSLSERLEAIAVEMAITGKRPSKALVQRAMKLKKALEALSTACSLATLEEGD